MHPYSIHSNERITVTLGFISFAILCSGWLAQGVVWVEQQLPFTLPFSIAAPSVITLYSLLYKAFDLWIWRIGWLCRFGIIKTPDLNGHWAATITPQTTEFPDVVKAQVEIKQTWTSIKVMFRAGQSISRSVMAAIDGDPPEDCYLRYGYYNEPHTLTTTTMAPFRGAANLRLEQEGNKLVLDGDYFTGRTRFTHGALRLEKIKRKGFWWLILGCIL